MKYVIKNCPAIKEITTLLTSEPPQFQKEWRCCAKGSNLKKCENITDCAMKKIVEKCRETCRKRCTNDCLGTKKHCGYGQILQLLDIEECE